MFKNFFVKYHDSMNPIAIRPARDRRGEIGSEPNGAGNGFKTDPRTRADDLPRKRKRRFRGDRHLYLRFRRFSIADRTRPKDSFQREAIGLISIARLIIERSFRLDERDRSSLIARRFDRTRLQNQPRLCTPKSTRSPRSFHDIRQSPRVLSRKSLNNKPIA